MEVEGEGRGVDGMGGGGGREGEGEGEVEGEGRWRGSERFLYEISHAFFYEWRALNFSSIQTSNQVSFQIII